MTRIHTATIAAVILCLGIGCKLTEVVTAPPGDPVNVVEAVVNAGFPLQTILVKRSQAGDTMVGLGGASVQVTDLDPRGCATPVVQFAESLKQGPGVYHAPLCPLAAGDRLALRVTTPDGKIVTGMTRVPGITSVLVRAGSASLTAPGTITMDRTKDTLSISATLARARAMQVEAVRTTAGEDPTLAPAIDTNAFSVPGNLVDPSGDGRSIFRAGAYYQLSVSALDTNYFDFVRSETNPLTGSGFLNNLTGGVGVFGSVAPMLFQLRVIAPQTDPREGVYQLTGTVGGKAVNVTWDVYGDPIATTFRAFMDGQWVTGVVHTSVNGTYVGTAFRATIYDTTSTDAANPAFSLSGTRANKGTPFTLLVRSAIAATPTDTVTAVQVQGP